MPRSPALARAQRRHDEKRAGLRLVVRFPDAERLAKLDALRREDETRQAALLRIIDEAAAAMATGKN